MREQTVSIASPKAYAEALAGSSSSSGLIDLNQNLKTTTSEPELFFEDGRVNLSPEWSAVDFSPLAEIGFTQTHLVQLAKQVKLSVAEVEASIQFFAFDLKRNGKGKSLHGSPLNFFMGILRKGIPYAPLRTSRPKLTRPAENFSKASVVSRERRLAEEQELKALAFGEWRRGLSESQAVALVPDAVKDIPRAREASLRLHFDETVYPRPRCGTLSRGRRRERAHIRAAIAESLGELSK